MKKTFYLTISFLFVFSVLFSQNGNISNNELQKIKNTFKKDANTIAITNALTSNDISKLVLNRDNVGKTDHFFKYKVDVKGITNQKSSGRCWMFTGLNVLRPKLMKKYNLETFEFSTNYLYFYDQLEKANLFLETVIATGQKPMTDKKVEWLFKSPINDGGVWNSLTNLVEKYGLIPKQAMSETYSSENTRMMVKLIKRKLREDGLELRALAEKKANAKTIHARKIEMLAEIYRMLALNLGEPPSEFSWRYTDIDRKISELKKYTPQSFFKETLPNVDFNNYVMLMNDPSKEYYKLYEIELDRNVLEGKNWLFLNLPSNEIKTFAKNSIKNNEAMYASCDVGKQLNRVEGLLLTDNYDYESLYGIEFEMNKKERIISFESGSTHGMALVAVDVDENDNPTKWQFENSWGENAGHLGYLTFSDKWFDEYMFRIVVLKKFIDEKTLKLLDQKPILLPPWDPMFSSDE
ncbi:MAG: C1 family peptidase [Bacteroidetes bacterium]|jgi:bleomycin hydrolase|nr:C1 family peptidase [Bacteroidota bacterium]MBT6687381.1 C1 family peptidase [Bacteroidota bacterium]MBT7143932.1 C1 family peptidase [Bacteroidota bacterium]MBT7492436.1 C1 family peptidase [Bacteroidota bacterium]